MTETRTFEAPILAAASGGTYVEIPFDVEQAFGKKRVPVQATIDGVAYRGSLVRMGGSCHVLGVLKSIRAEIGKGVGDIVTVAVTEDTAERVVEVPEDLRQALAAAPGASERFERLSYSHKREYVNWIESAKREETRARRVAGTIVKLEQGE